MYSILSVLAFIFYLTTVVLVGMKVINSANIPPIAVRVSWLVALALHLLVIVPSLLSADGLNLALLTAGSLVMLIVSAVLFFSCLYKPLDLIAIWILPITATLVLINFIGVTDSSRIIAIDNFTIQLHIVSSLLAYSVLLIASAIAIMFHVQNRLLRQGKTSTSFRILPPLDATEYFLFHLVTLGLVLLTISLITGWLYHDDLFAQHLVHKTVLSVAAWILLLVLLGGRLLFGWRERKVVQFIMLGTLLLVLAYSGSKLVLEVILDRV